MPERIQKILARHGIGSRREIERWIAEGRVTVNRVVAQVGAQIERGDRVAVDGKEVTARLNVDVPAQVLLFHKVQGQSIDHARSSARHVVDASAALERSSDDADDGDLIAAPSKHIAPVLESLPRVRGSRWVAINPMHAGDSGLLLLTNDGNLSYALTRRKRWIQTAYMVRVLAPGHAGVPPELPLHVVYDTASASERVEFLSVEPAGGEGANLWYRVTLTRADRRAAVRALFESHSLKVSRMTQVAFAHIELPRDLPRGRHRSATAQEVAELYHVAQIPQPAIPERMPDKPTAQRRRKPSPDRRTKKKAGANAKHGRAETGNAARSRNDARTKSRVGPQRGRRR